MSEQAVRPGALALVGSGEYTPAMNEVDRALLATLGGPAAARVVVLPTASGLEPGMPASWNARGVAHFQALGTAVTPVPLVTRADAFAEPVLAALRQANFFYLSGGNPQYAIEAWRDTPAWALLTAAYRAGGVIAGCSAGAMMLGSFTISVRGLLAGQAPTWEPALDLVPGIVTVPHFDRMRGLLTVESFNTLLAEAPPTVTVVGVDEDTALIHFADRWEVGGSQGVTVFHNGHMTRFPAGAAVPLPHLGARNH